MVSRSRLSVVNGAESRYKLEQLAERAGVSPRTVRYYVQRGLLPAPEFRGRDTAYTGEHLVRLQAIRRLQERFLPLDTIQERLAQCPTDEVARIASGEVTIEVEGPREEPDTGTVETEVAEGGLRWSRWVLGPGLELHLADDADDTVKALAARVRRAANENQGRRGRR